MRELLNRIEKALYRISDSGKWVGNVLLLGIVFLIVVDIVLRYVFSRPLAFTTEVVQFALGIIVFLGIVICTAYQSHVKIDILLKRFTPRVQATLNSIFWFFSALIFGLMVWQSIVYAMRSQDIGLISMMLKLPHQPFILIMAFFSFLTCLILLSQFIRYVIEAIKK